jgi:hypothetical protein
MARAVRLSEKLAYLLGADPAPTKPHSLLREEQSVNYRHGDPRLVVVGLELLDGFEVIGED